MDYKYKKYKNKYRDVKNQIGGASTLIPQEKLTAKEEMAKLERDKITILADHLYSGTYQIEEQDIIYYNEEEANIDKSNLTASTVLKYYYDCRTESEKVRKTRNDGLTVSDKSAYYCKKLFSMNCKWPFATHGYDLNYIWYIITTHNKNCIARASSIKTPEDTIPTFYYSEEDKNFIETSLLIFKSFFISFDSYRDCSYTNGDIYTKLERCNSSFNKDNPFDIIKEELVSNLHDHIQSTDTYSNYQTMYNKMTFDTKVEIRHSKFLYILSVICKVIEKIHLAIISYSKRDSTKPKIVTKFSENDFKMKLEPEIISPDTMIDADKRRWHILMLNKDIIEFNETIKNSKSIEDKIKSNDELNKLINDTTKDINNIKEWMEPYMDIRHVDNTRNRNFSPEEIEAIIEVKEYMESVKSSIKKIS